MLLVHACCADCALKILASIKQDTELPFTGADLYFYNPNIHPQEEYLSRHRAIKQIAEQKNVNIIIANWSPSEYFNQLKQGLNTTAWSTFTNKSERCLLCWQLRLEQTFRYASQNGYTHATSTLLSSKYQNIETIKKIANDLSRKYGLTFFVPKSIVCEMHTSGFYKQNYCGCVFSLQERYQEKFGLE